MKIAAIREQFDQGAFQYDEVIQPTSSNPT